MTLYPGFHFNNDFSWNNQGDQTSSVRVTRFTNHNALAIVWQHFQAGQSQTYTTEGPSQHQPSRKRSDFFCVGERRVPLDTLAARRGQRRAVDDVRRLHRFTRARIHGGSSELGRSVSRGALHTVPPRQGLRTMGGLLDNSQKVLLARNGRWKLELERPPEFRLRRAGLHVHDLAAPLRRAIGDSVPWLSLQ